VKSYEDQDRDAKRRKKLRDKIYDLIQEVEEGGDAAMVAFYAQDRVMQLRLEQVRENFVQLVKQTITTTPPTETRPLMALLQKVEEKKSPKLVPRKKRK
jgi:histidinol dehydrogenase